MKSGIRLIVAPQVVFPSDFFEGGEARFWRLGTPIRHVFELIA
ncbi:MAG: hypothetical protein AAF730_01545 [Bacteroidota bacterium]